MSAKFTRHGLSIGINRIDSRFFMTIKAIGKLTHADYQEITPMIDSALQGIDHPQVDVLADLTELDGWELRAAWDDFKLGLKHGSEFRCIAVIGNRKWQEYSTRIAGWFVPGEVEFFESEEAALNWLRG